MYNRVVDRRSMRVALFAGILLACSLLVATLYNSAFAQVNDAIEYPENGMDPVATFTAEDPEGESIVWSLAAGGDMEDFAIKDGVLRFMNSPDFEDAKGGGADGTANTYVVTVQASDGGDTTTATKAVMIEVTNVEEPGTVTLDTLQPQVGVLITATLTDPDNIGGEKPASISWQWYRGNTAIAGGTSEGAIISTYTPAAGDIGSVLSATAMYDDDEGDDKAAEQDSAHAAREAPTSNVPPTFPTPVGQENTHQERKVAENTPAGTNIGAPVTASDTDVLTYSLDTPDVGDEAEFDINRATGQLITKEDLDHEGGSPSYTVMVHATDPFGADVEVMVTIMVTDVNEAPTVTGASSIDHAENGIVLDVDASDDNPNAAEYTASDADMIAGDPETLKWSLSGADASKFEFGEETGAMRTLAFKANPDYESPGDSGANNLYEVTVVVTDTKGNTDEQTVMVKVTNIEELGAVELSTLQPRVGFPVTATLTDPDNITADSVSWQWYRDAMISITAQNFDTFVPTTLPANECDATNTNECSIKGATSAAYVPVDADVHANGYSLTAVATYTDGNGDGKDYAATASANDVLANTINEAPVFPDLDSEMEGRQTAQERSVGENVPVAFGNVLVATELVRPIGNPVEATDEDTVADRELTYSLGGPDAASFSIIRASGQLQTKAVLDKEMEDTYTVTVTATDSLSASSTITVTIKVDNVDEMPKLEGEAPEEYAENGTRAVANFRATDPEGESITWTLGGEDIATFSIENGVLRFKKSPDYEAPANAAPDNTYAVTIQASDGGVDTTATKDVSIKVTNVEEPGTVMLSTLQPQVDREITATLNDPDNEEADTVTWQWYRGNSPISGATVGVGTVTSTYTPDAGDIGSTLRAQAMYDDVEDDDKTARSESFRSVRSAPPSNNAPVFPDQTPGIPTIDKTQTREVAENTRAGTNLGAPIAATDAGDLLTYSLGGTNGESFDIVRSSGQIRTKAALDFEGTPSTYRVTVTATDPSGVSDMATVIITVTNVNEAPMFNDQAAASIDHEEGTTVLDVDATDTTAPAEYTVSDPDTTADSVANLKWTLSGADASKFELTGSGDMRTLSFENAPDFESPGDSGRNNVYEVTLIVTDSKGNTAEQDVTVKVTNMEEAGLVELSTLQPRVDFPITATLTDADNITANSVSWQWYKGTVTPERLAQLDGVECEGATTSNECFIKGATSATYTPVAFDVNRTLVAVALYTDGSPNAVDDPKDFAMMVTAQSVLADTRNKAPVFEDQDVEMDGLQTDQERMIVENTDSGVVIGDLVVATDSITANDGGVTPEVLTYSLGGADAASFSINRITAQLSTKADLDYETKDTYTVTVTATDPSGETATITVTINVTDDDEAPEIMVGGLVISGKATVDYAEDSTGAVDTYSLLGPDAASATWSHGGADAGDFTFTSGVLSFRSLPNYEAPADADTDNVYRVTLTANDGTYMDTHYVTVTVTNVDEAGEVTLSAMQPRVGVELTAMLSDDDGDVTGDTWQWARSDAKDGTYTDIGGATSASYMPGAGDENMYLRATAMYTDGHGPNKSEMEESAQQVIANTAPVFAEATDERRSVSVEENTVAGMDIGDPVAATDAEDDTVTYTLGGADMASFTIDSATGQLMTMAALDFETKASYTVDVTATDDADESDTIAVTINVTDVNEAPEFDSATTTTTMSVVENTAAGENIGDPVAAMDADAGDTLTYTLGGTDMASFAIDSATGQLMTMAALDFETKTIYTVDVRATDAGGESDTVMVTINVTDVNEAPEFDSATTTMSVDENTAAGENIGDPVAAMDADAGDTVTYTLGGTDMASFAIDSATGQLMTMAALDFETKASYSVDVTATDPSGLSATVMVTINVNDVNEAPEFDSATATTTRSVVENTAAGENIGDPVAAMDSNAGDTLTYTLGGTDMASFAIDSATGQLMTMAALDFETKASYTVDVTVTDDAGESDTIAVTIMVTDVDDDVTLLERYDTDVNGVSGEIDKSEILEAAEDYFAGELTKAEILELAELYFA